MHRFANDEVEDLGFGEDAPGGVDVNTSYVERERA